MRPPDRSTNWSATLAMIERVRAVLVLYVAHLPLTIRQIFSRLVASPSRDATVGQGSNGTAEELAFPFFSGPLHLENLGLGPPLQRAIEDRQDVHSRPQST